MGPLIIALLLSGSELTAEATARYNQASQQIGAQQYGPAIATLNGLATEYPRAPEIFTARCSALVGAKNYPAAEADCSYALRLKPGYGAALYALAMAFDYQGKSEQAAATYRQYASLDEKQAPYRGPAAQRADLLSRAAVGNGPSTPPLVSAGSDFAGAPGGLGGKLVVYRNHLSSYGQITLVLDGKLVGDISMDEYVEIDAAPGEHLLEARAFTNVYDPPRVWNRPVQLGAAPVYTNFETRSGQFALVESPAYKAQQEIRSDCKKAFSRQITASSVAAPPVTPPATAGTVYVAPGAWGVPGAVVIAPGVSHPVYSGARGCRFSSDCGDPSDYSCRSWRGQNVCMGYGGYGSPCWFGSDCLSDRCDGQVCR